MQKKLNILFISGWYPNRLAPTLGNFVQKHAEAVSLYSNVAAVHACSDKKCKGTYEITGQMINQVFTVNVYYKKVTHSIPLISQVQKFARYFKAYRKGIEEVRKRFSSIDLVHHNILYPSGMIALYLKRSLKIPYIVTEHSTAYLSQKKRKQSPAERTLTAIIARNAAYITPVSKDLQTSMQNLGILGHYEIVYNVADTKVFHPAETKKSGKLRLLHISTLDDRHKNISGMLRAAAELSRKRNDFEFHFIGDGDTKPHIRTAKELNIYKDFAFFDGTQTTEEVAALMRSSDCFVMFSNYENLPCVITEALASGIPVLSSDVGGIREHIGESNGMLVPAGDEAALVSALDNMLDRLKERKYDPAVLSQYAESQFSYEKVSEKFHHLYHRVLNNSTL